MWFYFIFCLFICFFKFKFKFVNIQCSLGFQSRTQWFISYIWHPVLIPKSALLNACHPFNTPRRLPPIPATLSLFSVFKGFLWLSPFCVFILLFLPFPYVHLFCFLNSIYEWNHMIFIFLWLISLSIIPFISIHVVANGKISFFFIAE